MAPFIAVCIYFAILSLILFIVRKNVHVSFFFKVFYLALIRTKCGLDSMDRVAHKYSGSLRKLAVVSVVLGFLGMFFISVELVKGFFQLLTKNATPTVGVVLPFDVKGAVYVPFEYWLISILIIMFVHEFSHGIFARLNTIKVKSSGLAFLGAIVPLIPGAFVDVDERSLRKKSLFSQLSVFSAGPFANVIFAGVFFVFMFLMNPLVDELYAPSGVRITDVVAQSPAAITGLVVGESIRNIDGRMIQTTNDFSAAFDGKTEGSNILIENRKIMLGKNPANNEAFLGVIVEQEQRLVSEHVFLASSVKWLKELFFWLFALNLGVGLFNLLPLGPLDGGRMVHVLLCHYFAKRHVHRVMSTVNMFLLLVLGTSLVFSFA